MRHARTDDRFHDKLLSDEGRVSLRQFPMGDARPGAATRVSPKRPFRLPDFSGYEEFQHLPEQILFIPMFRLLTEFGYSSAIGQRRIQRKESSAQMAR
jgi:hypothetical protein